MLKRLKPLWVVLAIIVLCLVFLPGFTKYLKLKRKETEVAQEISRLRNEIIKLQREEHLLKTDLARLEQVVREELGLVKPGEIVVKVVEEEIPISKDPKASKKTSSSN